MQRGEPYMSEKELLRHWLTSLYSSLKSINQKVEELERRISYAQELNNLQLSRIDIWLEDEDTDLDVKEDLEQSKDIVRKIPENNYRKLERLKMQQKSSLFMISKIEKELRD